MKRVYNFIVLVLVLALSGAVSTIYAQCNNDVMLYGGKGKGSCRKGIAVAIGQHETPTAALSLPHFKGGNRAMCRYINKTKVYPVNLKSQRAEGTAVVQAKVLADSTLTDIELVTSSGYKEMDEEALRVVRSFPKMCPATQSCTAQDMIMQIPIKFSMEEEEAKEKLAQQKEIVRNIGPITLYFENDRPDPRTKNDFTSTEYKGLYDTYMTKMNTYVTEAGNGLSGNAKSQAENEVRTFFNDSIATGYDRLQKLTNTIVDLLESGSDVTFTISGFASPLSNNDYNMHLSSRRIESVLNYMKQANGGKLAPYITGEKEGLTIYKNPNGEVNHSEPSQAHRVTVYGLQAAKDRRIVIHNLMVR
ncbi:MAG: TonB family protein [Bacteroidales bacterium]|nr:TonB family protein [Bacteroidales bacterium]